MKLGSEKRQLKAGKRQPGIFSVDKCGRSKIIET
jgi:hypothetical protein